MGIVQLYSYQAGTAKCNLRKYQDVIVTGLAP
jgi:hypothetical protein